MSRDIAIAVTLTKNDASPEDLQSFLAKTNMNKVQNCWDYHVCWLPGNRPSYQGLFGFPNVQIIMNHVLCPAQEEAPREAEENQFPQCLLARKERSHASGAS